MDILAKQRELQEYEASLKGKTKEELEALEQEIIKECDKIDEDCAKAEFPLPKENYTECAAAIRMLLDKQTVTWQNTLALVAMYDFWAEKNPKKVVYPMLDLTLTTLGQLNFTGYKEAAAVVAINKYFESIRDAYGSWKEKAWDAASKHNAIIEAMKLYEPIQSAVENGGPIDIH